MTQPHPNITTLSGIVERRPIQKIIRRCLHTATAGRLYSLCMMQAYCSIVTQKSTLGSKGVMVGGCIQRTTQSEGPQKKRKVLQVGSFCAGFFFFCCIETRFNCGIGTQFPLSQIQRKTFVHVSTKTIKRDKDRQGKSVRTAELHNKQKQHGSYQRGAPGLLQVTE